MSQQQAFDSGSTPGGIDIQVINGDIGSATGQTITISAGYATRNSGATILFNNSGSESTLEVTDANGNTFFGTDCGVAEMAPSNSGYGFNCMTNANVASVQNCAFGQSCFSSLNGNLNAGYGFNCGLGFSGSGCTFMGAQCAEGAVSAVNCTASGWMAMNAANGAASCVAIGVSALFNCSAANNIAVGQSSMQTSTTGSETIAIGSLAIFGDNNPTNCVVIGHIAMRNTTTGAANSVVIGHNAATAYTTNESNNIVIGSDVLGTAGDNNQIIIGNQGSGANQQDKCRIAGITGSTVTGSAVLCDTSGNLGTVVSSARYKENIEDLKEVSILDLRPVQFTYKPNQDPKKHTPEGLQYGLIAEEVHETFPYLCLYDKENRPDSVKYHELPILLLNEIKKLRNEIEDLKKRV